MTSPTYASFSQEDDCSKQRASKACNRCRAKKARCSGGYPCSRCKSSDTVCIFGFAKKSKREVFPEHYVRTLEMQQFKLAAGLQTMYFMLLATKAWPGTQLPKHKGNPLVHDVPDRLGLLEPRDYRDIDLDIGGQQSDAQSLAADDASSMASPEGFWSAFQSSPTEQEIPSAEPHDSSFQFQYSRIAEKHDNLGPAIGPCHHPPMQYESSPCPSDTRPLPSSFVQPPSNMAASLPSIPPRAEDVSTTSWNNQNYLSSCWLKYQQLSQPMPCLPINLASNMPETGL